MSPQTKRFACPACTRKFLSHTARQRHYNRNPSHAHSESSTPQQTRLSGSLWVEFDSEFETFLSLPNTTTPDDISVTYDADEDIVQIAGDHSEELDASAVPQSALELLEWTLRNGYLLISAPKPA